MAVDTRQPDFKGAAELGELQGDLSVGHRRLAGDGQVAGLHVDLSLRVAAVDLLVPLALLRESGEIVLHADRHGPHVKHIKHATQILVDGLASIHEAMVDMADGHIDNEELIRGMFSRIHVDHDTKGDGR
ncbi:hypothetical protein GCM10020256_44030 [Streptomyces thermocoprophilus]